MTTQKPRANPAKTQSVIADGAAVDKSVKNFVNWAAIEPLYRAGEVSLRALARDHGVSHVAIGKKAKRCGWVRKPTARVRTAYQPESREAFVYLIEFEANGKHYFKIGMSHDPQQRLQALQTSLPFDLQLVHSYRSMDAFREEAMLHRIFAKRLVRGEWYALTHGDVLLVWLRGVHVA